ncbi:MAG: penicillin-binding transpeptidase domain-containing protein [Clostridium sp.]
MKDKRNLFLGITVATIILIGCTLLYFILRKPNTDTVLQDYFTLVSEGKYEEMYSMLSSDSKRKITKDDFINRNRNIYSGIEASSIKVTENSTSKLLDLSTVDYSVKMKTLAGEITYDNKIDLLKEDGELKVVWNSSCIFPNLDDKYKVKVNTFKHNRGKILDRNDKVLAIDSTALNIGVIPGSISKDKSATISKLSTLLGISVDDINSKLNASYVRDDMFIPLKVLPGDDPAIAELKAIPGVMTTDRDSRVYPFGEKTAHLTGYVQLINEEEFKLNKDKNYTHNSLIGKTGIEKVFEDKLRAYNGYEIIIVNSEDVMVESIAKSDGKSGEDVKLTIDMDTQLLLYDQIKNDAGTSVASNPKTGEILAMVSTPSYNPNDFVLGISNAKWDELNNNPKHPLVSRFESKLTPGSVFKPIAGAIALEAKTLNPNDDKKINSLNWQKDKSWGQYTITRAHGYGGASNFQNAMVNSDNIYFAQAALSVGMDNFSSALNNMGFNESIPFEINVAKSQYTSDGKFKSEIQLADTGYGQGEVLVNPVHLTSIYSMFVNDGNMLTPYLIYKEDTTPTIWKKNVISKENSTLVLDSLKKVVTNGTGRGGGVYGLDLAGKTGTAEIKSSKDDTSGTELGWFIEMTTGKGKSDLLVVTMVEDVKGRGGSGYVVPLVRKAFEGLK